MADNLYFSRDTKLFASIKNVTNGTVSNAPDACWEIPILDGFSFSQANNTSEITLSEMESSTGVSRRGRRLFNDSLAPAEWSFSTYVRPVKGDGDPYTSTHVHAVEEILWANMAGADYYDATADAFESNKFATDPATPSTNLAVTTADSTDLNVSFSQSNRAVLHTIDLYFVMETNSLQPVIYKLESAVVNEATVSFDVDGIATIEWSGFAKNITDQTENTIVIETGGTGDVTALPDPAVLDKIYLDNNNDNAFIYGNGATGGVPAIDDGIASTSNFIRNRLTQLDVTAANTTVFPGASNDGVYNLTLTGGSITISNNIEYLTPEEIGQVNIPLENVTGSRAVSGSFTCYLNFDDGGTNLGTSTALFNDFKSTDALNIVTNEFDLAFNVGGKSANTNRLQFNMNKAHLEIPVTNIEDVISVEVNFVGLGTNITGTDEVDIVYFSA